MSFQGSSNQFESSRSDLSVPTVAVHNSLSGEQARSIWLVGIADPVRLHILCVLSEVADATAADLAAAAQASPQTLRRHLEALVSLRVIVEQPGESDGETPGRPAARFSLSAEVRESVRSALGIAH